MLPNISINIKGKIFLFPESTIPKCFFSLLKQKKKKVFERLRNQMLSLRIIHVLSNIQNTVKITRMHSSRMRTARSSSCPRGGSPPGTLPDQTPRTKPPRDQEPPRPDPPPRSRTPQDQANPWDQGPPPRGQTHTCERITLPQPSFAGGN